MTSDRLEVHEHCYIRGPRANRPNYKFEHSHAGGDQPHSHPDTGPASYTIDKDAWLAATGLRGGGRKVFTPKATGEQLPLISRPASEATFEVIVLDPSHTPGQTGEGGGLFAAARIAQTFKLRPVVIDGGEA